MAININMSVAYNDCCTFLIKRVADFMLGDHIGYKTDVKIQ